MTKGYVKIRHGFIDSGNIVSDRLGAALMALDAEKASLRRILFSSGDKFDFYELVNDASEALYIDSLFFDENVFTFKYRCPSARRKVSLEEPNKSYASPLSKFRSHNNSPQCYDFTVSESLYCGKETENDLWNARDKGMNKSAHLAWTHIIFFPFCLRFGFGCCA